MAGLGHGANNMWWAQDSGAHEIESGEHQSVSGAHKIGSGAHEISLCLSLTGVLTLSLFVPLCFPLCLLVYPCLYRCLSLLPFFILPFPSVCLSIPTLSVFSFLPLSLTLSLTLSFTCIFLTFFLSIYVFCFAWKVSDLTKNRLRAALHCY